MANLMIHHDHQSFQGVLSQTALETGFSTRLIEKDYFLSLILSHISVKVPSLVFKGGTSLNKVHVGFYRLSEDLDFCISTPLNSARTMRSNAVLEVKELISEIPLQHPCLSISKPMRGYDNSHHYSIEFTFRSAVSQKFESIKVEISLREPVLESPVIGKAATLILESLVDSADYPSADRRIQMRTLSIYETYAEKVRAALTRREAAIRDFFDLDYAYQNDILDFSSQRFLSLVSHKLLNNRSTVKLPDRTTLLLLSQQMETHLMPVLEESQYVQFDLERPVTLLQEITTMI